MAEYIKREEAMYIAFKSPFFSDSLMEEIKAIPAADVMPVVHGRWIETDRLTMDGKPKVHGWECAVCKRFTRSPFVDSWNYCPNCGAKMDGGTN